MAGDSGITPPTLTLLNEGDITPLTDVIIYVDRHGYEHSNLQIFTRETTETILATDNNSYDNVTINLGTFSEGTYTIYPTSDNGSYISSAIVFTVTGGDSGVTWTMGNKEVKSLTINNKEVKNIIIEGSTPPSLSLDIDKTTSLVGETITFTPILDNSNKIIYGIGQLLSGQTIDITDGTSILGSGITDNNGIATITYTGEGTGEKTVYAICNNITSLSNSFRNYVAYDEGGNKNMYTKYANTAFSISGSIYTEFSLSKSNAANGAIICTIGYPYQLKFTVRANSPTSGLNLKFIYDSTFIDLGTLTRNHTYKIIHQKNNSISVYDEDNRIVRTSQLLSSSNPKKIGLGFTESSSTTQRIYINNLKLQYI